MARRTITRTAATAASTSDYPPAGATGRRVVNVVGVNVEVYATDQHDGGERLTRIAFPIPGERGNMWAVVGLSQLDGSRWMVGFGGYGWQHDEYPTIVAAVEAVCSPAARAQMLARSAHWHRVHELERELAKLRDTEPEVPAGAIVVPPAPDPLRTLLGLPQVTS